MGLFSYAKIHINNRTRKVVGYLKKLSEIKLIKNIKNNNTKKESFRVYNSYNYIIATFEINHKKKTATLKTGMIESSNSKGKPISLEELKTKRNILEDLGYTIVEE